MAGKTEGTGMGPVGKSEIEQWAEKYATEMNGEPRDGTSTEAELHFNAWDNDRMAFLACYRQLCQWAKEKAEEGWNTDNTTSRFVRLSNLLALAEKKEDCGK